MGYTHYWQLKKAVDAAKWQEFLVGARKIFDAAKLQGVPVEDNSSGDEILINGIDDEQYEDFFITSNNLKWSCCKTARRLYDPVVTAILILLKEIVGDDVKITSDGQWDEELWECGIELYKTVFVKHPNSILD